MQKQNSGRSEVIELHTRELGPRYGIASWSFVRRDKAGREIGRLGGTYALVSTADGWKIATIVLHPLTEDETCPSRIRTPPDRHPD